jgi:hypothetical protein
VRKKDLTAIKGLCGLSRQDKVMGDLEASEGRT